MTDEGWKDKKYGGMSEMAAKRSHAAWIAQGRRILPAKEPPASDAQIELIKRQIEIQLQEYVVAVNAGVIWFVDWKRRRGGRGFRCLTK